MKPLKAMAFALILLLLLVAITENLGLFTDTKPIVCNLWFWEYESTPIPLAVYYVFFFLLGLSISSLYGVRNWFGTRKIIKTQQETIAKLAGETELLKGGSNSSEEAAPEDED